MLDQESAILEASVFAGFAFCTGEGRTAFEIKPSYCGETDRFAMQSDRLAGARVYVGVHYGQWS
ncbi:MAG TPA: hypothetical protein DDZ51_13850 [Planctomycetaceae bacterium]|nr:hypothetical protein [Planctomycetaceae bacterium]